MKIIFLDIDGVMNNYDVVREACQKDDMSLEAMMGKSFVERLNDIVRRTNCQIVISSSWRRFLSLVEIRKGFKFHGFQGKIISTTPELDKERGYEIDEWMKRCGKRMQAEKFVIIDDDDDMVHLSSHLVQTDMTFGLTDVHVEKIVELLNE